MAHSMADQPLPTGDSPAASSTAASADPTSAHGPETRPAAPPKRRRTRWRRLLAFLAILYVVWCVVLYYLQDKLLFAADLAPAPLPLRYDATTEEIRLDLEGGGQVVAWLIPALPRQTDKPAPLVIFFHGNAELIDYQDTVVQGYRRLGCSILLPEYRGYGRSAGKPSEETIVADAVRVYDQAVKRPDIDPARVIFHGRSLGGGPAAALAARRTPRVLILESTFTSVAAMASKYWAPAFLVKNPFHSDRVVEKLEVPILIFHGTDDDVIPVAHGRKLRDLARHGQYVEYNCKHNDFPGDGNEDAYWTCIADFLREAGILTRQSPPRLEEPGSPINSPAPTTQGQQP